MRSQARRPRGLNPAPRGRNNMRDAIVIAIVTGALITGAVCGIVGGALGICGAAIVIHRLADG